MKQFCENEFCDTPGAKVVSVSVREASDQKRTLCATCEEVFSWGVQHGTMVAQAKPVLPHVDSFLKKEGFVILARNDHDPSAHSPFEAWAYRGPLDLQAAAPVTFGVGTSIRDALDALETQLHNARHHTSPTADAERQLGRGHGS